VYVDSFNTAATYIGIGGKYEVLSRLDLGMGISCFQSKSYNDGRPFLAPVPILSYRLNRITINMVFFPNIKIKICIRPLGCTQRFIFSITARIANELFEATPLMPELPEVETIIRGLRPRLLNQTLRRVRIIGSPTFRSQVPSFLKRLHHYRIEEIRRHGKGLYWSLAALQNPKQTVILKIKLGMTGQFQWIKKTAPLENHTHMIFEFMAGDHELRYRDIRRFGQFELMEQGSFQTRSRCLKSRQK